MEGISPLCFYDIAAVNAKLVCVRKTFVASSIASVLLFIAFTCSQKSRRCSVIPVTARKAEWILRLCHDFKRCSSTNVPYLQCGHTLCSKVYNSSRILVRPKGRFWQVWRNAAVCKRRTCIMCTQQQKKYALEGSNN